MDMVFEAGEATMQLLQGAYSCISLIHGVGLVAFRDPHGIRPLVLGRRQGRRGEEWCVASEDCAFGPIGFERVRDVAPGEMIIIDDDGRLHSRQVAQVRRAVRAAGAGVGKASVGVYLCVCAADCVICWHQFCWNWGGCCWAAGCLECRVAEVQYPAR
jgi:hypothetical protein